MFKILDVSFVTSHQIGIPWKQSFIYIPVIQEPIEACSLSTSPNASEWCVLYLIYIVNLRQAVSEASQFLDEYYKPIRLQKMI